MPIDRMHQYHHSFWQLSSASLCCMGQTKISKRQSISMLYLHGFALNGGNIQRLPLFSESTNYIYQYLLWRKENICTGCSKKTRTTLVDNIVASTTQLMASLARREVKIPRCPSDLTPEEAFRIMEDSACASREERHENHKAFKPNGFISRNTIKGTRDYVSVTE